MVRIYTTSTKIVIAGPPAGFSAFAKQLKGLRQVISLPANFNPAPYWHACDQFALVETGEPPMRFSVDPRGRVTAAGPRASLDAFIYEIQRWSRMFPGRHCQFDSGSWPDLAEDSVSVLLKSLAE